MSIYLSQDNLAKVLELPVGAGSISFRNGSQNKTYDLLNIGQVSFLNGNPLQGITIDSILPGAGEKTGLTNYQEVQEPQFYIDAINELRTNKKPVRITITEINLSWLVSIEDFPHQINGGSDEYPYTLSLREFKDLEIQEIKTIEVLLNEPEEVVAETANIITTDRPNEKAVPIEVTVISGDSLWKIAKRELGDGSRYTEIAAKNDIQVPYLIFPGEKVLI